MIQFLVIAFFALFLIIFLVERWLYRQSPRKVRRKYVMFMSRFVLYLFLIIAIGSMYTEAIRIVDYLKQDYSYQTLNIISIKNKKNSRSLDYVLLKGYLEESAEQVYLKSYENENSYLKYSSEPMLSVCKQVICTDKVVKFTHSERVLNTIDMENWKQEKIVQVGYILLVLPLFVVDLYTFYGRKSRKTNKRLNF